MRPIIITTLFMIVVATAQGQSRRKAATYLSGQYSHTLYDFTKTNNKASYGVGLQTFFKTKTPFSPTAELSADFIYLDDKVLRVNTDGSEIPTVTSLITLFGGTAFHFNQHIYVSVVAGPAYISNRLVPGIKPSLGFYFDKNQRFTGKVSYTNIFNRYKATGADFGSLNASLGCRL